MRAVMVFEVRPSLPLRVNAPVNVRLFVPPMINVKLLVPLGYWIKFAMVRVPPEANTIPLEVRLGISGARYNGPVPIGPVVTAPTVSMPNPMAPVVGVVPPE